MIDEVGCEAIGVIGGGEIGEMEGEGESGGWGVGWGGRWFVSGEDFYLCL